MTTEPARRERSESWTLEDAEGLYGFPRWGMGYFAANRRGHLVVRPAGTPGVEADLFEIVSGLRERGITTPILLRFGDLLAHRIGMLNEAFTAAMRDHEYRGTYLCAYPIKVNQQRHVVEAIRRHGSRFGFGLEVGSKPELLAVLGTTSGDDGCPILCNGFKDGEFIRMVILAAKLGRRIVPVVEKLSELPLILEHAERYGVRPAIGVRVKLSSRGAGRWEDSGGLRSKFGLYVSELLEVVQTLRERDMLDCLQLLHCHVGSQVFDIRSVKRAITELAHVFVELRRLGAGVKMIDIGGGLGVDYDGSQTSSESSVNYSIQEYAADVVHRIMAVCDEAGEDHPTIVSESGRALVAYHSVLVFDVRGATSFDAFNVPATIHEATDGDPEDLPQPLWDLYDALDLVARGSAEEAYHDAVQAHEEAMSLFRLGHMSLEQRGLSERLYWAVCARALALLRQRDQLPEEMAPLAARLSDIYFCNLSIFQSLPDSWAIGQLFPIVPLHRLDERPVREAILGDMTCDSEGKITRFVCGDGTRSTLPVHPLRPGEPYYLGAFLTGAYQEILGDLHNLFGDTHDVQVEIDSEGGWSIEELVEGDSVREVLEYVQFKPDALLAALRRDVERATRGGRITVREGRELLAVYREGLNGYTYLEEG